MAPIKFPRKLGRAKINPSRNIFSVSTPLKVKIRTTQTSKKYKNRRLLALITEIGWELATYSNITGGPGLPVKPPVKPPNPPTENITTHFNFPLYLTPKPINNKRNKDKSDTLYL